MNISEYPKLVKQNKYRNKKIVIDGITFPSTKEGTRYSELKFLEKTNRIKRLRLQHKFELQPSFEKNEQTYRAINYIADFSYYDVEKGAYIIEDVKGFDEKTQKFKSTAEYKLKKKMFEYKYPEYQITEV
jgi:hypothetical protein